MYIQGFVIPVPEDKQDAYRDIALRFTDIMKDHGMIEVVEAWEADVPDGVHTDFRRAVALEPGEKVVFSWVVWPDKATCDAAHASMMAGEMAEDMAAMAPFDGKRMIFGGFEPIVSWRK
ncbi:MAG: DUF1428 domain-containing protein [Novosphingobium sp.]|nr:DUF1428 domain-containing protein [Novosphingobium sp.]MBO9600947.1 DUF1428 domain-containing protein [Novosphingobium sp.]